jgi:hypothetical protein
MLNRAEAIHEIYFELRNGGVAALRAAALLYMLGVTIAEVSIAMSSYGD